MSRRCACTATLLCADCARLLARSEGRTSLATGWSAASTSTQLQGRIFQHLKRLPAWRGYHTHDSRKSAPGFPDLILLRIAQHRLMPRQLVAELKNPGEYPTREQQQWLEAFWLVGSECYIWMANDEPDIVEVLQADVMRQRSTAWLNRLGYPLMLMSPPRTTVE